MARTQQQIKAALENCTVAAREAAAAVIADAAKNKPDWSRFKHQEGEDVYGNPPSRRMHAADEDHQ